MNIYLQCFYLDDLSPDRFEKCREIIRELEELLENK